MPMVWAVSVGQRGSANVQQMMRMRMMSGIKHPCSHKAEPMGMTLPWNNRLLVELSAGVNMPEHTS
jgi:hypothetical protein